MSISSEIVHCVNSNFLKFMNVPLLKSTTCTLVNILDVFIIVILVRWNCYKHMHLPYIDGCYFFKSDILIC